MKPKVPLCHLVFLAICVALSLVTKRVISPITNVLTDFLRIPGGGAATAFSLMFLVIGTCPVRWSHAATAAAFVQSLIALSTGMSAYQGAFVLLTYTLPGVIMDLMRRVFRHRNLAFFSLSCGAANTFGALLTDLFVFRLHGTAFLLWMLVAWIVGLCAGLLGGVLFHRIVKSPEFRRLMEC